MRRVAASAVAASMVLLLAACSAGGWLPHERSGTATDPAALEHAWSTPASPPSWLPADATEIRWIAATRGGADRAPAAVRLRSSAAPAGCEALKGSSAAAIAASWEPGTASAGVLRCGNWAVQPVPGGWYGWTPVEPDAAG